MSLDLLTSLVNRAIARYPAEAERIQRGAEIVGQEGVQPPCAAHPGHYYVGLKQPYPVNGHCPCPDARHNAPEGKCKHRWAKALYVKLQTAQATLAEVPSLRVLAFYASLADANGIAEVREDGLVRFQAEGQTGWLEVGWHEVALGGRKDLVDAYYN